MPKSGWAKQEIQIEAKNLAMFGYGQMSHRATKKRTPLFARTILITVDADQGSEQPIIFCCLDLGCITFAMRDGVVQSLSKYTWFDLEKLVLMATHTHSAPGGCSYDALYNMATPGFVAEHVDLTVQATVQSISDAYQKMANCEIRTAQNTFATHIPVAWNRSLDAYNQNPEVTQRKLSETHLALDREMNVLGIYQNDQLCALMSLFGVHATCLGNQLDAYDGDNKGYAAASTEQYLSLQSTTSQSLSSQGVLSPVAIFAQSTAGDVSPHFHGKDQLKIRNKIQGEAEYQYAERNGQLQSECALQALNHSQALSLSKAEAVLQYIDLSNVDVDPEFSRRMHGAKTSQPCHGSAFFAGTPVDGLGTAKPIVMAMNLLSNQVRKVRLNPKHPQFEKYQALYASQGNKPIVLEAGEKKILGQRLDIAPSFVDPLIAEMNRQYRAGAIQHSQLVPTIVPIQLVQLGEITIVCCAGEVTTIAGQRLKQSVAKALGAQSSEKTWLISYCNDYMGYVTTNEEYQLQAYEGGHTLYGQWTLAALQTRFSTLAQQIRLEKVDRKYDQNLRPLIPPKHELAKRTNNIYSQ